MQRITGQKTGIYGRITLGLCVLLFSCGIFLGSCKPPLQSPSTTTTREYSHQPLVADLTPKIYIDGMDSSQDWDNCPWVNGSGSFIDPYIIHNISIDGNKTGSCIIINNTQDYFKIENCSLFNAGYGIYDAGIRLLNVSNSLLQYNNCSANKYNGISLSGSCKNNSISDNNCTRNYYYGISLYGSANNTLGRNNCTVNYNSGIYLYYSSNNTIRENNCSENNDGVYLSSATNNTLEANICIRNYRWGINLAGAKNDTLFNNVMVQDGVFFWGSLIDALTNTIDASNLVNGKPIWFYVNKTVLSIPADTGQILLAYCNDTVIQDISTSVLIAFYSCFNNTIRRNNCSGYVNGIELWESSNNTIVDNTCFGNNQDGIYLYDSVNNTLRGNNCSGNPFSGIHLQSNLNNIEGNNCSGNVFYGIYLEVSNNCSVQNNICRENNIGIMVDSSDYCTFDGNTCQLNRFRGIYFSYSHNNTLTNNLCSVNEDGIYLDFTSHNNTVTSNNCSGNSEHGIYVSSSNNNSIWGNNCSRNQEYGIYLSNSNFTEVFQNLVKKNWQGPIIEVTCSSNYIHDNTIILFLRISIHPSSVAYAYSIPSKVTILLASAGQSIGFECDLMGGNPPFIYQWNFGDNTENATDINPTHIFTTAGKYTIICSVIDADGDVTVYQMNISLFASDEFDWVIFVLLPSIVVGIVATGWFVRKHRRKRTQVKV